MILQKIKRLNIKGVVGAGALLALLFAFQNCGPSFKTSQNGVLDSSSFANTSPLSVAENLRISLVEKIVYTGDPTTLYADVVLGGTELKRYGDTLKVSYQWLFNGKPLAGETGPGLTIANAQAIHQGKYFVTVSISESTDPNIPNFSETLQAGVLTVLPQFFPVFTAPFYASTETYYVGDKFEFSNTNTRGGGVSYRWYKDDVLIPGATAPKYSFAALTKADSGIYKLEAYNTVGSAFTSAAITVNDQIVPVFSANSLSDSSVIVGNYFSMGSLGARGGSISYRWYKDNVLLSGRTTFAFYKVAEKADAGVYKIEAYNTMGSAYLAATLTVADQTTPAFKVGAAIQSKATYIGDALRIVLFGQVDGGGIQYRWYKDGVLVVGATTAALNIASATLADSGTYKIEAYNSVGSAFLSAAVIVKPAELPAFPKLTNFEEEALTGESTYLSGEAATGGLIHYRWYKDGRLIPGATGYGINVYNAQISDSGDYKLEAYNSIGSAFLTAHLTVTSPTIPVFVTGPPSQSVFVGDPISLGCSVSTRLTRYRWYKDDVVIVGQTDRNYLIAAASAMDAGVYKVEAYNSAGSSFASATVTTKAQQLPVFAAASLYNQSIYPGESFNFWDRASGGGVQYRWYKDGMPVAYLGAIYKNSAVLADAGVYKLEAYNSVGSSSITGTLTVKDFAVPTFSISSNPSFFAGEFISISTVGATGGGLKYRWFKDEVPIVGAVNSSYIKRAVTADSGTYRVEVYNSVGTATKSIAITVKDQLQPFFTSPLINKSVYAGDSFSFNVYGTIGGGALGFRWSKNGVLLPDKTNGVLSIGPATLNDIGTYQIEIYNTVGSATEQVQVSVLNAVVPVFDSTLANETRATGGSLSLNSYAKGGGVKYRWYKDGILLSETGGTVFISTVTQASAGVYKVEAYNSAGVSSQSCVVTVTP